jgi:DNA-binding beta-propeller fold protein YncE
MKSTFIILIISTLIQTHALEASPLSGPSATYTKDRDFDLGSSISVVHEPSDQLQLDGRTEAFNFIWVAVSTKGTVVKIDTLTGQVLGEYRTAPQGRGLNPSRTTVDQNGNVWVANRNESGHVKANAIAPGIPDTSRAMGAVVHIGLKENGQCVDRNGNGIIETSSGLGEVLSWENTAGADELGGISTATDECILHYTRVNSYGTRHVSVNKENNVWVSGTGGRYFDLIDGTTGKIIKQAGSVNHGGYGGLIDGNGVIWSAKPFMRWDTALPLTGTNWTALGPSYGLCIDSKGNVWATSGGSIYKYAPDGKQLGQFSHGGGNAQGCVVDQKDHVWIAHSLSLSSVGHILNDGTYVGSIKVGSGPTGVAVDSAGKIWATNFNSRTVTRIDPTIGPIGADGTTRVGEVDFTSGDLGGNLYNYSDMTGSTLRGAPKSGTWTVIHDSETDHAEWGRITWHSDEPGDSSIKVSVSSSEDRVHFGAVETVVREEDLTVNNGRYLKIDVSFWRSSTDDTPVLYDLSLITENCLQEADCFRRSKIIFEHIEVPPQITGKIKLKTPPSVKLGEVHKKSEILRLDNAAKIEDTVQINVSSNFEHGGAMLEIDFGDGWVALDAEPKSVFVNETDNRNWPVRLRTGWCPEGSLASEAFKIFIEGVGIDEQVEKTEVPVTVEIVAPTLWSCWWPVIAAIAVIVATFILIHGFWSPSRFAPRLGVVLSPEDDIAEGFFHPIRARRGFYRDARAYICADFRIAGKSRGAIARLRAYGKKACILPVGGNALYRQTIDGEWEEVPSEETVVRSGILYKDSLGTLFFEIRNG